MLVYKYNVMFVEVILLYLLMVLDSQNNWFVFIPVHLLSISLAVSAGQQYFRVQPHDTKVQEGGEAMLECEVAMLAGAVQWTKDGFALGKHWLLICQQQIKN